MTEIDDKLSLLRALLTETLPYELPLGFTNENLFLSELRIDELSDGQKLALKKLRRERSDYTRPFLYKINRSSRTRNTLAIIHPNAQLRIAEFLPDFEQTIVQACTRSPYSIRFPSEPIRVYTKGSTSDVRKRWRLGLPEQAVGDRITTPYSPSYFGYRKYLLLERFFTSNELVRLESRFRFLRTLDISRCFPSIYSHSITWARKEKGFSKDNSSKYSFEQRFDELMQKANYNETAGIVVGPEVSRIFAEVILQSVDIEVERRAEERELVSGRHYEIRRYVDDFHIFTRNMDDRDTLTDILSDVLEEYKLYLNVEKSQDLERPFITSISRVKYEVTSVCESLVTSLTSEFVPPTEATATPSESVVLGRKALDAVRHLGGSERSDLLKSLSEVFTALQRVLKSLKENMSDSLELEEVRTEFLDRLKLLIRVLFYVLSLDFRVPPLIRAAFIVEGIIRLSNKLPQSERLATRAYLAYELSELLGANYDGLSGPVSLENLNTFLLGLMVDPTAFCLQSPARNFIDNVMKGTQHGYFAALAGLHYLNSTSPTEVAPSDPLSEADRRQAFVVALIDYIGSGDCDPVVDSEDYLLFCDALSCPALDSDIRWSTFNQKLGGQELSKADFQELTKHFRHTNWTSSDDKFQLLFRRLPPVYFSS
ncbi:antiviral reverse transcriptase Drt3b [Oceanicola sp. 502str15]|uniref:antiviral reverse transcriptase Drt3b n=1 Tax=Oceanicola sp. 502str15 TaxID=2696061 RepID=UPI0020944D29|nr:antiviral reverse transcriptase Drt3b [Oceanicola sp. 502str15]MCO6382699.1 hypothetical protein [Oceanicola sp. 502str15]